MKETQEVKRKVFVMFCMDCERIEGSSPVSGGPKSWQLSEKAIMGFGEVLKEKRFSGGFYIQPECAAEQAQVFLELEREGFELGSHFHTQCFRDLRYKKFLAEYNYAEQMEILGYGKQDWEEAIGHGTKVFRAGNGSASDDTFPILYHLGYRTSSLSFPGRYRLDLGCNWLGAFPFAHHASSKSRLICGELDVYEIPLTVHPWRNFGGVPYNPLHLRPETCSLDESDVNRPNMKDYKEIIEISLDWQIKMDVPVRTLIVATHNTADYFDKNCEARRVLECLCEAVEEGVEKAGLELVRETSLEKVHQVADLVGDY